MSFETILGLIVAGIIVLVLLNAFSPSRKPKNKSFKCSGCGARAKHTKRSIEAWRNNKRRFFCQSCHSKWLQTQPKRENNTYTSRGSRSGCLGMMLIVAIVPLASYLLVQTYA